MPELLVTLGNAPYDELIKPSAELYLKRVIEQSVAVSMGLEPALAAAPQAIPAAPWARAAHAGVLAR